MDIDIQIPEEPGYRHTVIEYWIHTYRYQRILDIRHIDIDRQRNRQRNRQKHRQRIRQKTDHDILRETEIETNRETARETEKQTEKNRQEMTIFYLEESPVELSEFIS